MPDHNQILYAIEVHSIEGIRKYFEESGSPNDILPDGMPLFTMMIEMYTRTPRFAACVQAFIDAGLEFGDKALWVSQIKAIKKINLINGSDFNRPQHFPFPRRSRRFLNLTAQCF